MYVAESLSSLSFGITTAVTLYTSCGLWYARAAISVLTGGLMQLINDIGKYVRKKRDGTLPWNGARSKTDFIVIHHAAARYPRGLACQRIFEYHSRKWPDYGRIAYQIVLQEETDGTIGAHHVNPLHMIGAGVWGMNKTTVHICCATLFDAIPSALWFNALVSTLREHMIPHYPAARVVGHTDIALAGHGTSCPGVLWHQWRGSVLTALANGYT